jgi:hypothetical protein
MTEKNKSEAEKYSQTARYCADKICYHQWIYCKDRLPELTEPNSYGTFNSESEEVMVALKIGSFKYRKVGVLIKSSENIGELYWFAEDNDYDLLDVTHWMPLLPLPDLLSLPEQENDMD